mgnify:CR=1 FL=1
MQNIFTRILLQNYRILFFKCLLNSIPDSLYGSLRVIVGVTFAKCRLVNGYIHNNLCKIIDYSFDGQLVCAYVDYQLHVGYVRCDVDAR